MTKKHREKRIKVLKMQKKKRVILNLIFDCPPLLGAVWNTFITPFSPLVMTSTQKGKLLVQATESCDSY